MTGRLLMKQAARVPLLEPLVSFSLAVSRPMPWASAAGTLSPPVLAHGPSGPLAPVLGSASTSAVGASERLIAEAGDFTILAGDSAKNLPLKATFTLPKTLSIKEGS